MAAKLSISIVDPALVAWAQKQAADQQTSVSAVVSDALRLARLSEARRRYFDWVGPVGLLTPALEAELRAEIEGTPAPKKGAPRKKTKP